MENTRSLQIQTQCLKRKQLQDMDIELEKEIVEETDNNVKESRAKFQKILDKAYRRKKVKSKESVNDDK